MNASVTRVSLMVVVVWSVLCERPRTVSHVSICHDAHGPVAGLQRRSHLVARRGYGRHGARLEGICKVFSICACGQLRDSPVTDDKPTMLELGLILGWGTVGGGGRRPQLADQVRLLVRALRLRRLDVPLEASVVESCSPGESELV